MKGQLLGVGHKLTTKLSLFLSLAIIVVPLIWAIHYYEKALAINPNYAIALHNKQGQALANLAEKNNNTRSPIPFLRYENSTLGIRMVYPSDWQKEEHGLLPSDPGVTFSSPVDRKSPNYPIVIYIQIEPSGGKTLDKYTFEQIDSLRQDSDNILNTSTISLPGNNSANRIEYTGKALGIRTQEMQVYTMKDDQAYTIWYLAQPTTYTKYLPTVQKMIDSFELTSTNQTAIKNESLTKAYQNSTFGIKIQYPSDWRIKEKDGVVFYAPDFSDSGAYVEIFTNDLAQNATLDQDINGIIKLYEENLMNFKVVELNTNSSLAGNPAYTIVYTYNDQGTDTKVREIGTLINNSKEYFIRYYSEEASYTNNLLTSEKMIRSFEIIK